MKLLSVALALLVFASAFPSFALTPNQPEMKPGWINPQLPVIPDRTFKITDYGAIGDGTTMNTGAFHHAIRACKEAGGGRIVVPKGVFVTASFELFSHCALIIEKDGVVQAPPKFSDYGMPDPLPTTQRGMDAVAHFAIPLILAMDVTDVEISGEGRIDGAGAKWWAKVRRAVLKTGVPRIERPNLIVIDHCQRLRIAGITLSNSPQFHLVPKTSSDVLIENVTIDTPGDTPNTDGIDPFNCHDLLIRHCTINDGDDDIVIKSPDGDISTRIEIADCTIKQGHGISIGSDTNAGVRWMLVHDCTFEDTGSALRIKSSRARGGPVEHIVYQDITMKNVQTALELNLYYDDRDGAKKPEFRPITKTTPSLRYVALARVHVEDAEHAGMIVGLPESPCENVKLEDVSITCRLGLQIQDAQSLSMHNVDVKASPALAVKRDKKQSRKHHAAAEHAAPPTAPE